MDITISRADLARELDVADRVASKKPTLPVTACVSLSAGVGGLTVAATDLDVSVRTGGIAATVHTPGACVVPVSKFYGLVKTLADGDVSLTAKDGKSVTLSAAGFKASLQTLPAEDFPTIPERPGGAGAVFVRVDLLAALKRVRFCITKQPGQYALDGALLEYGEKRARLVATDGHRLSAADTSCSGDGPVVRLIVSRMVLDALAPALEGTGEDPVFLQTETHLFWEVGDRLLVGRQMSGQFPAYERVLPRLGEGPVIVGRAEFVDAVRRAGLVAGDKAIRLVLETGGIRIESHNVDVGAADERLDATYEGAGLTLALNSSYLEDFLASAGDDKVAMHITTAEAAVLFTPAGVGYRHVIMPMRG